MTDPLHAPDTAPGIVDDIRAVRRIFKYDGHGDGDTCPHASCADAPCEGGEDCDVDSASSGCDPEECFAAALEGAREAFGRIVGALGDIGTPTPVPVTADTAATTGPVAAAAKALDDLAEAVAGALGESSFWALAAHGNAATVRREADSDPEWLFGRAEQWRKFARKTDRDLVPFARKAARALAALAVGPDGLERPDAGPEKGTDVEHPKHPDAGPEKGTAAVILPIAPDVGFTAGPDDIEPVSDPAERTKAVARELRHRGIHAQDSRNDISDQTIVSVMGYEDPASHHGRLGFKWAESLYRLREGRFAQMTDPRTIADEIQAAEAKRAAMWAGDTERPEKGTAHPVKPLPPLPDIAKIDVRRSMLPNAEMTITYPVQSETDREHDRALAVALTPHEAAFIAWEFGGALWCVYTVGTLDVRPIIAPAPIPTRTLKFVEYRPRPNGPEKGTAQVARRPCNHSAQSWEIRANGDMWCDDCESTIVRDGSNGRWFPTRTGR